MKYIYVDEIRIIEEITSLFEDNFEEKIVSNRFDKYSSIYTFTTENLSGYIPKLNLPNRRVLTVCGSGDHIINVSLFGAKEIVAFDINILSGIFTELKLLALSKLSYEEYLGFFMRDFKDNTPLDINIYNSIRENLGSTSKYFFDNLYILFNNDGSKIRESRLFNNCYDNLSLKTFCNPYLRSKDSFDAAKKSIISKKISWLQCSVQDICKILDSKNKFDAILLSNISDYAHKIYTKDDSYLDQYTKKIIIPLKNHLNINGYIISAYIYDVSFSDTYRTKIDNPTIRKETFSNLGMNYKEIYFKSVLKGKKDGIILNN